MNAPLKETPKSKGSPGTCIRKLVTPWVAVVAPVARVVQFVGVPHGTHG